MLERGLRPAAHDRHRPAVLDCVVDRVCRRGEHKQIRIGNDFRPRPRFLDLLFLEVRRLAQLGVVQPVNRDGLLRLHPDVALELPPADIDGVLPLDVAVDDQRLYDPRSQLIPADIVFE